MLNGDKCIHSDLEQTWNELYDNNFDKDWFIFIMNKEINKRNAIEQKCILKKVTAGEKASTEITQRLIDSITKKWYVKISSYKEQQCNNMQGTGL